MAKARTSVEKKLREQRQRDKEAAKAADRRTMQEKVAERVAAEKIRAAETGWEA